MSFRLAAVSVDLDEIPCYTAIHGLVARRDETRHAIYRAALPRLADLFARSGIPATFFAIGRDLADAQNAAALVRLAAAGHEIGNHSLHHHYDLSRLSRAEMQAEVEGGIAAIESHVGVRPTGFRAPGYTINDALFDVLRQLNVGYDSSVFPCPAYYAAKVAAIAAIKLRGRRSRSVIDDPRVLSARANPYRIGSPYFRAGEGMLELPIGVTRTAAGRLPFIGTSLVLAGTAGARALTRAIIGRPLINLELHGIDLADAMADGLSFLAPYQPDLRRTAQQKSATLAAVFSDLVRAGYRFVTLAEAARHFGERRPSRR